jgi:hypothetical protein
MGVRSVVVSARWFMLQDLRLKGSRSRFIVQGPGSMVQGKTPSP